jgi:hypothetical protein
MSLRASNPDGDGVVYCRAAETTNPQSDAQPSLDFHNLTILQKKKPSQDYEWLLTGGIRWKWESRPSETGLSQRILDLKSHRLRRQSSASSKNVFLFNNFVNLCKAEP